MSTCLVTGAAGFIGSHLAERLARDGHHVIGVDCFTDYYPRIYKQSNLETVLASPRFQLREVDLLRVDLAGLLDGVDYIFHEAAQAGVRACWGDNFQVYVDNNILATQKLLEACRQNKPKKLIYASTSSIYGHAESDATPETAMPRPISPYGVSKLAGEHLCQLYAANFQVPILILRYFTVYGPRQRPDMAFHIFVKAMLQNQEISIFGDGNQSRDFTYIEDAVEANVLAMQSDATGEIFNVGGGSRVTMNETLTLLQEIAGVGPLIRYREKLKGEALRTAADISKAAKILGYAPRHGLRDGLTKEVDWLRNWYHNHSFQPGQAALLQ